MPFDGQPGNGICRRNNSCTISATTDASDGMTRSRTDTVTISASGSGYIFSQSNYSFVNGFVNTPYSGQFTVIGDSAVFTNGSTFFAKRSSPERIIFQVLEPGSSSFNFIVLEKRSIPPAIPSDLTATASGGVVALSWKNNATDQTGFIVARKTTLTGSYSDVGRPGATSFSQELAAGTYWYRVRATNANGDSLGSNEVVVTVP